MNNSYIHSKLPMVIEIKVGLTLITFNYFKSMLDYNVYLHSTTFIYLRLISMNNIRLLIKYTNNVIYNNYNTIRQHVVCIYIMKYMLLNLTLF